MKKLTFAMLIITCILFIGLTITSNPLNAKESVDYNSKRNVYLNIFTVTEGQYEMVKDIVGDKHSIEFLCNNKEEVDNIKLTEEIANNISKMDLFIYNGAGYEPWIDEVLTSINKDRVGVIDTSRGLTVLTSTDDDEKQVKLSNYNTGFNEYKISLYNIKSAIQDKDPQNRDYYEENYNRAIDDLYKEISQFSKVINGNKDVKCIVLCNKFDYFLNNYYIDITKKSEEEVIKLIEEKQIDFGNTIIINDRPNNKIPNLLVLDTEDNRNIYKDIILSNTKKLAEIMEKLQLGTE